MLASSSIIAMGVKFTQYDGMDQDLNGIWTTPGGDLPPLVDPAFVALGRLTRTPHR